MTSKKSHHSKPTLRSVSEAVKPPAPLRQILDGRDLNTRRDNPVDDNHRAIEKIKVARAHPNDPQADRFEHSAVATVLEHEPVISSLAKRGRKDVDDKRRAGKSRRGRLSPIHAAVERICAELSEPTLEEVLAFMENDNRMSELYDSDTDAVSDVEIAEIDRAEDMVRYRSHDGIERVIAFKTIANYASLYKQKKNILPASREASISG